MKRILVVLLVALSLMMSVDIHAQLQWREATRRVVGRGLTDPGQTDGIEIFSNNEAIVIRTQHRIQVRVFTILGQLVSSATLIPGTSELKINSRGIYIVKIGNLTQKVAL